ncbi:uncharacterized protein BDZ99DRAFT_49862 [Mytilinidion resinicola]|uniref:Uncharacterized protein n=1 Tax=Mytilinidion resinicola TaxID=574789 RepID=A0A6A6YJY6_9PEZI|nr:uncharacterized protein BDZ99DRAFT_49862 [Mytilinidion resinicola]KAF2808237.1 hypothetical protein BDZ99DRAFT_49862 [Mytilinidion resinicola]
MFHQIPARPRASLQLSFVCCLPFMPSRQCAHRGLPASGAQTLRASLSSVKGPEGASWPSSMPLYVMRSRTRAASVCHGEKRNVALCAERGRGNGRGWLVREVHGWVDLSFEVHGHGDERKPCDGSYRDSVLGRPLRGAGRSSCSFRSACAAFA